MVSKPVFLQMCTNMYTTYFMTNPINKNSLKTAKGYRLKNSTHKLIEKIQSQINGSMDTVVSRAVKLYYSQINNCPKLRETAGKKLSKKQ